MMKTTISGKPQLNRKINMSILLDLIQREGSMSRADLAKRTGIRAASISAIVQQLIDEWLSDAESPGRAACEAGAAAGAAAGSSSARTYSCPKKSGRWPRAALLQGHRQAQIITPQCRPGLARMHHCGSPSLGGYLPPAAFIAKVIPGFINMAAQVYAHRSIV